MDKKLEIVVADTGCFGLSVTTIVSEYHNHEFFVVNIIKEKS